MQDVKVKLDELKRAIQWMEANTSTIDLKVVNDGHKLLIEAFDRSDTAVTITLYASDCSSLPKITKTENL